MKTRNKRRVRKRGGNWAKGYMGKTIDEQRQGKLSEKPERKAW